MTKVTKLLCHRSGDDEGGGVRSAHLELVSPHRSVSIGDSVPDVLDGPYMRSDIVEGGGVIMVLSVRWRRHKIYDAAVTSTCCPFIDRCALP